MILASFKVPTQILRKTTPLTGREENDLKLHPQYSVDLLNLANDFDLSAKRIIEQHHELYDGSG